MIAARTSASRRKDERRDQAGACPPAEQLNRIAHRLLDEWGVRISPSKTVRLCRDYQRVAGRIGFARYLANNVAMPALLPKAPRNAYGNVDVTGENTARLVDDEREARNVS